MIKIVSSSIQFPKILDIHTIVFDFDGVFTNNKVWVSSDGVESVQCDRADGLGLDFLRYAIQKQSLSLDVFILSKESNPVVTVRAKKLKINCHHAVGDKVNFMDTYLREYHPNNKSPYDGLMYVGNDLNDLMLIKRAKFSVVPSDAHQLVLDNANIILPKAGGDGFVRLLIEKLLRINEMSEESLNELICNS
jgi:3-deoxy-D-manno-octulosonate 8-phosphate phosphatase (KDO 8-P phosphatase)